MTFTNINFSSAISIAILLVLSLSLPVTNAARLSSKTSTNTATTSNDFRVSLKKFVHDQSVRLAPNKNPNIANGQPARTFTVQHMVNLMILDAGNNVLGCSGTILDNRRILTAAHCVYSSDIFTVRQVYVVPGQLNVFVSSVYVAKHIDIYHKYNSATLQNDLAIITINGKLNGANLRPVKLPTPGSRTAPGSIVYAAGYGKVNEKGKATKVLRETGLKISPVMSCRNRFHKSLWPTIVASEVICGVDPDSTATSSRSICGGDSGGPLFVKEGNSFRQVGIASFQELSCTAQGTTSWFTNLNTYASDIVNHPKKIITDRSKSAGKVWQRSFSMKL